MERKLGNRLRNWLIGLTAAFAVLWLAIICIDAWATRRMKKLLVEKVAEASNGLYSLRIGDADIGLLSGNINLEDIELIPDTALYQKLKAAGKEPSFFASLKIPSLRITGLHLWKAWKTKVIELTRLRVSEPSITLRYHIRNKKKDKEEVKEDFYQLIEERLKDAQASQISIDDLSVDYHELSDSTSEALSVKASLAWEDIHISEASRKDTSHCLYSKSFELTAKEYVSYIADSAYTLSISNLRLSSSDRYIGIDSVSMNSNKKKAGSTKRTSSSRVIGSIAKLELVNIDLKKLLEEKALTAHMLHVTNGNVQYFKDKRLSSPYSEDKPMPQQALRDLQFPLILDSLRIENVNVAYEEISSEGKGPGRIAFNNINAVSGKLSNTKEFLAQAPVTHLHITGVLMKQAKIELQVAMHLADKNNTFTCKGKMSSMDLPSLNVMTERTGVIRFTHGVMDGLTFNATFTENRCTGKVLVAYHDLGAELLNKETGKQRFKEKVASLFAKYKVPESNPEDPGEPLREGNIDYLREKQKSVFGYLWKSVQTGILSTMRLEGMADKVKMKAVTKK